MPDVVLVILHLIYLVFLANLMALAGTNLPATEKILTTNSNLCEIGKTTI